MKYLLEDYRPTKNFQAQDEWNLCTHLSYPLMSSSVLYQLWARLWTKNTKHLQALKQKTWFSDSWQQSMTLLLSRDQTFSFKIIHIFSILKISSRLKNYIIITWIF